MMTQDQLSICPKCESDACYVVPLNEKANSYFCFGCGFTSNDLQKAGEFDMEEYESVLPEIHKDLRFVDSENRVWYPATMNIPEKGTVFLGGKAKDLTEWCAIKVRPLTEDEQAQLANKGIKYKSDSKTLKSFGNDFIEALDYINFFEK